MHYIAYLHKTRKSDYGVSLPDFPGCITTGRSLGSVEGILEDVDPRPLDDNAGKVVRINITARQKQIDEIDRRARAAGLSRSAYIIQAALRGPSKRAAWTRWCRQAKAGQSAKVQPR